VALLAGRSTHLRQHLTFMHSAHSHRLTRGLQHVVQSVRSMPPPPVILEGHIKMLLPHHCLISAPAKVISDARPPPLITVVIYTNPVFSATPCGSGILKPVHGR